MQAKHSIEFARAPALWSMYPKLLVSHKPPLVLEGSEVPRIESRLANVVVDRRHLARYSKICGVTPGATLPIAYPHVLATPIHLAMLGAEAFPVRLFGLIHVRNRIESLGPLSLDAPAEIFASIEGHRETDRGQEFDLHTQYLVSGEILWSETCTFLARRRGVSGAATTARVVESMPDGMAIKSSSFRAPAGLGRRYGFMAGDVNPIHMSNLSARAFGFPRAIAHGMWSLARVASEFDSAEFDGGCELTARFKLPVYLPALLTLQRWQLEEGSAFAMRGAEDEPHVIGTLKSLR